MNEQRKVYEKRAEILTKKILSKIYALEYKTLEAKLDAEEGLNNMGDQVKELENKLKNLSEERQKLEENYRNMLEASEEKWEEISQKFEDYLDKISLDKSDIYERTQDWLNNFGARITDLENRARHSSHEAKENIMKQVENLKNQRNKLEENLHELSKESGERWNTIKNGVDEGLQSMKSALYKVYKNFQRSGGQETESSTQ